AHIARRCAFMSPVRDPILPTFIEGDAEDEKAEFDRVSREGLEWRLERFVYQPGMDEAAKAKIAAPYRERLDFELQVIKNMKFAGYFLIVSDFIRWAKEHG